MIKRGVLIGFTLILVFAYLVLAAGISNISTLASTPINTSTWKGILTFNVSTDDPTTVNVTIKLQDTSNNNFLPTTYANTSPTGPDGGTIVNFDSIAAGVTYGKYNITAIACNRTYDGTDGCVTREIVANMGGAVTIQNTPPKAINITVNGLLNSFQNFSILTPVTINVQAALNDSFPSWTLLNGLASPVYFALDTGQPELFNTEASTNYTQQGMGYWKNYSLWNATITLSSGVLQDGNYNITINVTDNVQCEAMDGAGSFNLGCGGNSNFTTYITVGVDGNAPTYIPNNPNNGEYFTKSTGNVTINATIQDYHMISFIAFSIENSSGTPFNITPTNNSGEWTASYNLSTLAEGATTISIFVNDSFNLATQASYAQIYMDYTFPQVTFVNLNLRNYTLKSNNQIFNFSVLEETIGLPGGGMAGAGNGVQFSNASGNMFNTGTANQSGSWLVNYNVSNLEEGNQRITAFATDFAGNTNSTEYVDFTVDKTAPNVTIVNSLITANDKNFSVSSFNQTFNVSIKDLLMNSILGVMFSFDNASGTSFNATPTEEFPDAPNSTWSLSYNVSSLAEGVHTVTIFANDTLGNQNATQTIQFTVDNTAPTVSWVNNNNSNYSKTDFNQTFNISINELNFVQSVKFSVDNGSGTAFNITATNVSGYWSASYNVSTLAEGNITLTVIANDSVGNINNSIQITLTTDYTYFYFTNVSASSLTTSAATITWNSSSIANSSVDYGTTEALGTVTSSITFGLQHSVALSSLTASTAYFYNVTSCDYTGNCNTTNSTGFTTSAAATTNTNTGNPGGSDSSTTSTTTTASPSTSTATAGKITAPTTTETNEVELSFAEIATEEVATVDVSKEDLGVTQVQFSVSSPVSNARVKVAEVKELPVEVPEFTGKTFKKLEISHNDVIKTEDLLNPIVYFKVEISWLTENDLTKDDVALHRFTEEWTELPTEYVRSDDIYQYYSAETPGFSYFIIGEKTAVVEITPVVEEVAEPTENIKVGFISKLSSLWSKVSAKFTTRNLIFVGSGVVALVALFVLIWLVKKKIS
jgi:large repetitive protein